MDSLHNFVYNSAHIEVMKRRKEWFNRMKDAYSVLWWVEAGHQPSIEEARERLEVLRREGPGPTAFTFKQLYQPPT